MIRAPFIVATLALAGCGLYVPKRTEVPWFEAASRAELQAERRQCYASGVCRALIDPRPPVLFEALSAEPQCAFHASHAEAYLHAAGYETRFAAAGQHTWAEAKIDGKWWAVDNGALPWCDRVCTADEARHGVK